MAKHLKQPAQTAPVRPRQYARHPNSYAHQGPRSQNNSSKSKIGILLMVVGIALILIAGGLFAYTQIQYAKQDTINEKLASYATVSDDAYVGPEVDWAGLKAVNDDVVGWIQIPGTKINYPVYQGETNDTYLRTTAEGEYSVGGQIFMDYENAAPGLVDRQTIIYGHHLNNGDMFASIDDMCDQSYFDTISTIWYVTEEETYELEPLFIYKSAATNDAARQCTFASEEDFHTYLSDILGQASAQSTNASEAVNKVSKVLTLCTCDYENDFGQGNGRGLLVCALKSEVE